MTKQEQSLECLKAALLVLNASNETLPAKETLEKAKELSIEIASFIDPSKTPNKRIAGIDKDGNRIEII